MNIFKRIWRTLFPSKEKSEQVIIEEEKFIEAISVEKLQSLESVKAEQPEQKTTITSEIPKFVSPIQEIEPSSLAEAKTALSKEWNKRKKKNIYDNHRIARDYKKINQLYEIINRFKAAQG